MLLHFIFVIKEEELGKRKEEFEYIKSMSRFFKIWIHNKFGQNFDIQCDEMIVKPRSIFQRIDTHTLIHDHRERGEETYHFYLCYFRPLWTDCTCEGYYAENFGMIWWQKPKDPNDTVFLAEKNCTKVSHELAHELLRQAKYKKYVDDIHEIWTKHFYSDLPFESYNQNFEKTNDSPMFLTVDTSELKI